MAERIEAVRDDLYVDCAIYAIAFEARAAYADAAVITRAAIPPPD